MSRAGGASPGQILAGGGEISPGLAAAERCQALGYTGGGVAVTEDFQGHLHALQIVHGEQDGLSLAVTGQGDPLVLLADPPRQLGQVSFRFGQ